MAQSDDSTGVSAARAARPVLYQFGEFMLDVPRNELRRGDAPIELQRQAFELLVYLVEHRERVVSRRELFGTVWADRVVTDNALSQTVAALRRALETGQGTSPIETVYGKGFRFATEVEERAGSVAGGAAEPGAAGHSGAPDPYELECRQLVPVFGPMLSELCGDLRPVRLFAVSRNAADANEVSILSIYTSLELTLEIGAPRADEIDAPGASAANEHALASRLAQALESDLKAEVAAGPRWAQRRYRRRIRAVEAAAVAPRLVITGPPGSGKSTLVQHLCLCLAGSILGHEEAHVGRLRARAAESPWMPWERAPIVPIFVEVAAFTASLAFASASEGSSAHLFAYLGERDPGSRQQASALERYLQKRAGEGALLVFDGLDEASGRESVGDPREDDGARERIKQVVRSFVNRFEKARVIVTSRPYAYEPGSPWRLDAQGFEEVELGAFSPAQVREFCAHWYRGMAERRVIGTQQIAARAEALASELADQPHLVALTERPLTLTLLADLHTQDGVLPRTRAGLYEESTVLFLNRWNAARASERPGENRLTEQLRIGLDELRQVVEHLAYEAQRASRGEGAAVLSAGQVIEILFEHGSKGESERVLDFLSQRSGILVADSRHHYRFPHRSYQEYLAACYLTYQDFPTLLTTEVRTDPERWREVVPLALGRIRATPYMVIALIDRLLDDPLLADERLREFVGLLCAKGVEEAGLRRALQTQSPRTLGRLHELLLSSVRAARGTERDRVAAAELLGQLGDPRVAELDRVAVAAGRFLMGAQRKDPTEPSYDPDAWDREAPVHEVELSAFEITRYPITVSQFARFIEARGYAQVELWHPDGWTWRTTENVEQPLRWEAQLRHPNRPVVGVAWYEAEAFARWQRGRLPSEAEFEYVARGGKGWRYAWGDEPPSEQHASFGGRFPHPVPVGIYASGAQNPWQIHDLCGNAAEWCQGSASWTYEPGATRDPGRALGALPPVFRSGWYLAPAAFLRATMRASMSAETRDHEAVGFRVVWSSADAREDTR